MNNIICTESSIKCIKAKKIKNCLIEFFFVLFFLNLPVMKCSLLFIFCTRIIVVVLLILLKFFQLN